MSLLITDIGRLFTAGEAGVVTDAAVLLDGERVAWVGPAAGGPPTAPDRVVSVGGALVTPGLIDAHTHPVYAGDRLAEVALRCSGADYREVAAYDGGIGATVAATRAAGPDVLARGLERRLAAWLAGGTTTIEAKTGYHLEPEGELGALALLVRGSVGPRVEATFLAAHDVPPEFADRADPPAEYAEAVAGWCAAAAAAGARFVDVFCDAGYFSVDEARQVLRAGLAAGLRPRVHADELVRTGGSLLAAEVGAASADHLLCATDEDARALARAGVVATLCPATALALGGEPPARLLADRGVTLALGSDHNPGQSGITSMSLVVGLAIHCWGLSVHEALVAATRGGARSLALADRGVVAPGMLADLVVWDAEHEGAFAWELGMAPREVWWGGKLAVGADRAAGPGPGDGGSTR